MVKEPLVLNIGLSLVLRKGAEKGIEYIFLHILTQKKFHKSAVSNFEKLRELTTIRKKCLDWKRGATNPSL